jgi:hypothetical protein
MAQGDGLPGRAGFSASRFTTPVLGDRGGVGFTVSGVVSGDDALVAGQAGALATVFRANDPAPLLAPGTVMYQLGAWAMNASGRVANVARLRVGAGDTTATNDTVLYADLGTDSPRLIARNGDWAPGLPSTARLRIPEPSANVAYNDAGQVALLTGFADPTVVLGSPTALYIGDPAGTLYAVAVAGQMLEVAPGDARRIATLSVPLTPRGVGETGGRWFNDAGQATFTATFFDGTSGVFVVALPSPGAAAVLLIWTTAAAGRRRRSAPVWK